MEEIWKDIQGYEGLYQISNLGNVKSLHYGAKANHPNWKSQTERIIKQRIATSGYCRVELYKPQSRKCFYVHRLVALTFIPNPENKSEVNHIDGNKLNNCVENLEWNTKSENISHSFASGLHVSPMKGRKGAKSPCSKLIIQYDLSGKFINLWNSISEAANSLQINGSSISNCAKLKQKTSFGYIWRYVIDGYIPMTIDVKKPKSLE